MVLIAHKHDGNGTREATKESPRASMIECKGTQCDREGPNMIPKNLGSLQAIGPRGANHEVP